MIDMYILRLILSVLIIIFLIYLLRKIINYFKEYHITFFDIMAFIDVIVILIEVLILLIDSIIHII